ncbi:hypothetical protein [Citrobacter rodentium]|uniref:hypothetical protein n=1 Tax=Citrobacter rodentium TaxID=67825 RepID=UPI001E317E43|nr:hypothetical protein [Citrobacter rodentium]
MVVLSPIVTSASSTLTLINETLLPDGKLTMRPAAAVELSIITLAGVAANAADEINALINNAILVGLKDAFI